MSRGPQRQVPNIRTVLRFVEQLAHAGTVERVYEAALTSISEIFAPSRSFVALVQSENDPPIAQPLQPGWLPQVVVTIHAGETIAGKFVLQYDAPRAFSEADLVLIEVMAGLTGFAIERARAVGAKEKKDELVAMAAHELRSPLTAIMGSIFLLRSSRNEERDRALQMIDRKWDPLESTCRHASLSIL